MELTNKNYFSTEMNLKYLDCSTYKNFVGTIGRKGCECRALAIAKGMYEQPKTTALLLGGYVDAYFDNTLAEYMVENMDNLYTKASVKKFTEGKGDLELLSDFKQADVMIKRAIKEPLFMKYMEGETQKILTADIDGVPIRVKLDSYNGERITDLKTVESMSKTFFVADVDSNSRKTAITFAEYWGYIEQAFFYRTAVEQNYGKKLPFYLTVITKEKVNNIPHPRVAVIHIPDLVIDEKGKEIKYKIHKVWNLLQGNMLPVPCGTCEWCADYLPLEREIELDQLLLEV